MAQLHNMAAHCEHTSVNELTGEDRAGRKDFIALTSYDNLVAVYDRHERCVCLNRSKWDCSNTTRNHVTIFIEEFCPLDMGIRGIPARQVEQGCEQVVGARGHAVLVWR